jgi:hypothetical protein
MNRWTGRLAIVWTPCWCDQMDVSLPDADSDPETRLAVAFHRILSIDSAGK